MNSVTGLSPLHQAIINEDPAMVSFLLQHGANINQRCYGASFCPDDQKSSRTDSLEHEYVELSLKTSYTGSINSLARMCWKILNIYNSETILNYFRKKTKQTKI